MLLRSLLRSHTRKRGEFHRQINYVSSVKLTKRQELFSPDLRLWVCISD
ncbi:hypothetical protein [Allocoleopsis sp.]